MTDIVLSIAGTVFVMAWLFILVTDKRRFQPTIDRIDGNEYFMKELFFVGFRVMGWLDVDISTPAIQKKIRRLSELFGSKEAKMLVLYDLAAQFTYVFSLLPIGMLLTVVLDEIACLFIVILLIGFLVIYVEYDKNDKLQKRHSQILREFPHILSQIALLVNAGMPLRRALVTAAQGGGGVLRQEMKALVDDMDNGVPEYEAFGSFAQRCGVDSVRKFSGVITQNIRKGSSELADILMDLSSEVWRNRVSSVKEEGEKASAKLMIPVLIIFIGILIMVAVPMLRSMNF